MGKLAEAIAQGETRWRPTEADLYEIDAARKIGMAWNKILDLLTEDYADKEMPSETTLRSVWKNWKNGQTRRPG